MIISILGNNIKTENIYLITSTKFTGFSDDDEELDIIETTKNEAIWYGFNIEFLNKKSIFIKINIHIKEEKEEKEEEIIKVNKLREEIIKIWSNNQSSIPKIEFES